MEVVDSAEWLPGLFSSRSLREGTSGRDRRGGGVNWNGSSSLEDVDERSIMSLCMSEIIPPLTVIVDSEVSCGKISDGLIVRCSNCSLDEAGERVGAL